MVSLNSRGAEGLWDLCLSLDFVLDSGNALTPVASDADCLSADRSHVHGHVVEELLVNTVHTLVEDHEILIDNVLEEVINHATHSLWADELAFGFLFLCVLVCFESATVSSLPPLKLMRLAQEKKHLSEIALNSTRSYRDHREGRSNRLGA